MNGLPWRTPPRQHPPQLVGTFDSGILEIPRFGGLTIDEVDTIAELMADSASAFVRGAKLAEAIAIEESISINEAFAIIEQVISGRTLEPDADRIRLAHAERMEQIVHVYEAAGSLNMLASMTAIIRHRLDRPDWTMAQTRKLPRVLRDDIWQFIQEEQSAEKLPSNRPTEDDLKKPLPVTGTQREPTGDSSSGACAMRSQERSAAPPSAAN